jgi:hypothetical protein
MIQIFQSRENPAHEKSGDQNQGIITDTEIPMMTDGLVA